MTFARLEKRARPRSRRGAGPTRFRAQLASTPESCVDANPYTIAIVGTVGIPASYGGFETLVENLAAYHAQNGLSSRLIVYCSARSYPSRSRTYLDAQLHYIPLGANGLSSVAYDVASLISAIRKQSNACLLLGVSGAIALPIIKVFARKTRFVTNIDGVEWRRAKWSGFARWFLRISEYFAVRFSDAVIADNQAIAEHVRERYGRSCSVIAYGGDHAVCVGSSPYLGPPLPSRYALSICRIEPENNPSMILDAFARKANFPLVFVGNWSNSAFGRELRRRYSGVAHLHLLDPIYDTGILRTIRSNAALYVHGHSAGGTNPSLVEMMHFGVPIFAYDCSFNRFTTDTKALFFRSADALRSGVDLLNADVARVVGDCMKQIAKERYTWAVVSQEYFRLLNERSTSDSRSSSVTTNARRGTQF